MGHRPRIGITMRLEMESRRFYLGRDYSEAVEAWGGVPVHISLIPKRDYIAEVMRGLDGVLLPGSNTDIDPHYYGEDPHPNLRTVIPEKDETDRLVLEEIENRRIPLLAICYGMQALNVIRGGTLIQDIASQVDNCIKHDQGPPYDRNSHGLKIAESGIFAELPSVREASGAVRVNTSHHQAIGKIGRDLAATAWTGDGVVECLEDTRGDRWLLAVQWHPEVTAPHDSVSKDIFAAFVGACGGGS